MTAPGGGSYTPGVLRIVPASLDDPIVVGFIEAHLRELAPQSPVESQHALGTDALRAPGVRVWAALDERDVVGTVALAPLGDGHEELKSMRADPSRRGAGIGASILTHALDDTRGRGIARVSLETGSAAYFAPARRLYRRFGFRECRPFGSYADDPHSVYFTLDLGVDLRAPGRSTPA